MPAAASGLPKHLEEQRTQVMCGPDLNYHVSEVVHISKPPDSETSLLTSTLFIADFDPNIRQYVYGTGYQQCMGLTTVG